MADENTAAAAAAAAVAAAPANEVAEESAPAKRDAVVEILSSKRTRINLDNRRDMMEAIAQRNRALLDPTFVSANVESVNTYFSGLDAFTKSMRKKRWDKVLVSTHLFDFWVLLQRSDYSSIAGEKPESEPLASFRKLMAKAEELYKSDHQATLSKGKRILLKFETWTEPSNGVPLVDAERDFVHENCPFCKHGYLMAIDRSQVNAHNIALNETFQTDKAAYELLRPVLKKKTTEPKAPNNYQAETWVCMCRYQHCKTS
jgi:hypothetical protein